MRAALRECEAAAAPAGTVAGVTEEGAFQWLHVAHRTPEGATHVEDQGTCRKGWKKHISHSRILKLDNQIPNDNKGRTVPSD